jgi:hypothetical protein
VSLRPSLAVRFVCATLPLLATAYATGCTNGTPASAGASPGATPSPVASASAAPAPEASAAASRSAFDGARAYADLQKQVAFGPRVPQTPGHAATRDWILAELKKSAGNAGRQDFTFPLGGGRNLAMSNLYARFNPDAKKQVMLCAHWDTRPSADQEIDAAKRRKPIPGANDGASGVAVLLELARVFAAKHPTVGVQIVLFDGEDYGPGIEQMFLGARQWAKRPPLPRPDYAILIDMIGDKDLTIPREANSERNAPEINDKVWGAAAQLGYLQFQSVVGQEIMDDHLPLQQAGWKAIDLIDFNYGPWHTLDDTPDKCSGDSLKVVGDVLARVVYDEK